MSPVVRFQNLGIVHIAKREVKDIISQRKKAELIEHARLRRPQCTTEEIRQSITPTDMKKVGRAYASMLKDRLPMRLGCGRIHSWFIILRI